MDCISLDVKNNWALKLGNLRRLKKALDKYLEEELKISNSRFDRIDLPNLARKGQGEEIIKLFECIFYAIVNCPQKGVFIKRIMDLEESVQIQLMFFIQKIIGENEDNPVQDSELFKKELEMLKNDKRKLTKQVLELEQELSSALEEKNRVSASLNEVKSENQRLFSDIDNKAVKEERHSTIIIAELRNRLHEKDENINEIQKSIDKIKKQYETEIAQIRDELDIANSKVHQNMNSDKTLKLYKKRLESLAGDKQKLIDLQKQNTNLMETVNTQHIEIEKLQKAKTLAGQLKETVAKEKNRADTLSFNLENKEKMMKKYEKEIVEYRQKISLLESKNEELALRRQDSSQGSEDSFVGIDLTPVSNPRIQGRQSMMPTFHEQIESNQKELNYQKTLVETKKIQIKALKERAQMSNEEMIMRRYEYECKILQLQTNNEILSDQIQIYTNTLEEKEHEKVVQEQTMYELEDVKSQKVALLNDIKAMHVDKEAIYKKLLEGRDELMAVQKQGNEKDMRIRELELEINLFNEKIRAFEEKEKVFNTQLGLLRRDSLSSFSGSQETMAMERDIIALKSENNELQQRLVAEKGRIAELLLGKEENAKEFEKLFKELEEKYKKELKSNENEIIAQSVEALNVLNNQRDQLASKLQFQKRNTMVDWQRAMSIRDPSMLISEEIFKLREILMERENEIRRVSKNNKDLKICWKDSAKLLKAVWKQLGDETRKIEEAVRKRNY